MAAYTVTLSAVQDAAVRLRLARLNADTRDATKATGLDAPPDLTTDDWVQAAVEDAGKVVAREESAGLVALAAERFTDLPADTQAELLKLLGLGDLSPSAALRLTGELRLDLAGVFAALPEEVQEKIFSALKV